MRSLINDGWSFVKLPCGSTFTEAEKAEYEPVDLPHDWLIRQENDLYESADAWYRREIKLPEDHEPIVMIRFDGVYMDCDVLLNGEIICSHPYGYTAFDVPLTGKLRSGSNMLMVHIRHQSPNSRWYSGSGIYRDVFLVMLPEDHLIPDGLYLNETKQESSWVVKIQAETAGTGNQPFFCRLYEREGGLAAEAAGTVSDGTAEAVLTVPSGRAWTPDDPYLYRLELQYGKQTEVRKIGLRSVFIHPDHGLKLNGYPVKLKGVCLHHDLGALGAAFHEKAAKRQLTLMKNMGANAVRTSHNPPASKFLDLCDEMGMLVVDEAFDMWERAKTTYDYARFFPEWYKQDISSWIRRDRCHPSVIMWSVGNEIYDMHADERGAELTGLLAEQVRIHDPMKHAFVTFGCNYMPWKGGQRCAEHVDAVGYNYGEKLYGRHHEAHPSWVIYGSETASLLSSRGIYHFPIEHSIMSDADQQCSALGNSNTSWGAESLSKILIDDLNCPYSMGQFIWSGIDYIGEPTPYHTRSCYFGQADTACFPKDSYYLFRRFWTEEKMIHIGVSWDWNEHQLIDIPVITNCSEAELIVNGKSLGTKSVDPQNPEKCTPVWKIPFEPGVITARGYDEEGNLVCEDSKYTPGETDHFILDCENEFLLSDGWDCIFVTVSAEDADNHPVGNARDRVKITVGGGGRLLGTDNGDSTDPDGYKNDCRRLFSGKLLLIIGSNGIREDVRIHVRRQDGAEAEMIVPVKAAGIIPGISCRQKTVKQEESKRVSARRVDIRTEDPTDLTPENRKCTFRYAVLPENASDPRIVWQVTNAAGIESPNVRMKTSGNTVTAEAYGDGMYYLRALCYEDGNCSFISQTEFTARGFGNPALDAYTYISAGLYDIHEGDIGTGNEKGIAFSRDDESMVGYSCIDFGKTGTDVITADIFALNGDPYEIELLSAAPGGQPERIAVLHYEKPSIWNVYQAETWKLDRRLTGIRTICFRMRDKVHMRGFFFEKQSGAYLYHTAGSAETVYGDCFRREGEKVTGIGNNVTLTWTDMDFGEAEEAIVEIEGSTQLPVNTICIRIRNEQGEERTFAADYPGRGTEKKAFRMPVPNGNCTVSFVFLPGSSFDFRGFCFYRPESWTEKQD